MYFPEIYSWDAEDSSGLESSEKARFDDKHIARFGGDLDGDHTRDFSRRKAAHSTVGSQRVQKNHRKKSSTKSSKGKKTVHTDFAAKLSAKAFDAYRISQPKGSKDRHSKVVTSKGPRDRRMRLSVATAISLYDLQDKLGLDQPSKTVEWLLLKAQPAIRDLEHSAYSNTGQEKGKGQGQGHASSLHSQNLNSSQKSGFELDLYANILVANSFPASTTESISNCTYAQKGETSTSAVVVKRARRDIANLSERKANRTHARERARQRTREKCGAHESQQLLDHLKAFCFVNKSFGSSVLCGNVSSLLGGCRNLHSSLSHPQNEIQSPLHTTAVQPEGGSLQSIQSFSCSNQPNFPEKFAPGCGHGYFPLSVPCTCSCCGECSGLECISEGQSSSNKETLKAGLQIADTRNICLNNQSSNMLTPSSPVSCFPSPPYQLLDAGYYAHNYPLPSNNHKTC